MRTFLKWGKVTKLPVFLACNSIALNLGSALRCSHSVDGILQIVGSTPAKKPTFLCGVCTVCVINTPILTKARVALNGRKGWRPIDRTRAGKEQWDRKRAIRRKGEMPTVVHSRRVSVPGSRMPRQHNASLQNKHTRVSEAWWTPNLVPFYSLRSSFREEPSDRPSEKVGDYLSCSTYGKKRLPLNGIFLHLSIEITFPKNTGMRHFVSRSV